MQEAEKLRRFCLLSSLILIIFSFSGISISTQKPINVLGLPVKIENPEMIGVGLLLICMYGLSRYVFYGLMRNKAPWIQRKEQMEWFYGIDRNWSVSVYQTQWVKAADFEVCKQNFDGGLFPRIGKWKAEVRNAGSPEVKTEGNVVTYDYDTVTIKLILPHLVLIFAFLEDFDYFLPVILGVAAIISYSFQ